MIDSTDGEAAVYLEREAAAAAAEGVSSTVGPPMASYLRRK